MKDTQGNKKDIKEIQKDTRKHNDKRLKLGKHLKYKLQFPLIKETISLF